MLSYNRLRKSIIAFALSFLFLFSASLSLCAIPPPLLVKAKEYFEKNKTQFANKNYLVVIDYSQPSNVKRFHLVDLKKNTTESYLTAHGKGSDPKHTGKAQVFGDKEGSRMTSLGFFKTTDTYFGQHGYSLRLEGLSETNKNALSRLIVIHGAAYVDPKRKVIGRSWGCPALEQRFTKEVIDKIKGGALVYSVNSTDS